MSNKDTNNSKKILLVGPPNVGKSVFFNKLTGLDVGMANYAGTTVDYNIGHYTINNSKVEVVDVPGTYSLNATNEAEEVAINMLSKGADLVICVVDSNHLESSLYLLLQVLEYNLPTLVALNRVDILEDKGYIVDHSILEEKLNIKIIPTVAISNRGMKELEKEMSNMLNEKEEIKRAEYSDDERWKLAEELTVEIKKKSNKEKDSFRNKACEMLISPKTGFPLALLILSLTFGLVVGIGKGFRSLLFLPLFNGYLFPFIINTVEKFVEPGMLQNILIGEYGFLLKGIDWPFGLVLPYILSFYLALSLLEDSGYLPRLGVLLDGALNKIGLSGANIIPLLLGYGCAVPGIMATRAMNTRKERYMVSTMICLAVPCVSQTGAFVALMAEASVLVVIGLFLFSFLALIIAGMVLNKTLKGEKPVTIVEMPELLIPKWDMLGKKLLIRLKSYVTGGAITMIYGIAIAAVLYESGMLVYVGRMFGPLITGWLRLPEEAAIPLVLGIVRRELSVLPLLEMNLNNLQLFVGAVVGLFYIPCVAVLAVLAREFKVSFAVFILVLTTSLSFLVGGIIANIGALFL